MTITILKGLPDPLRAAAAELYWDAFGDKLGRVMGPRAKAVAFLQSAIQGDHALIALSEKGKLLGLVGFKTMEGSFAGGQFADLRRTYGLVGAAWRSAVFSLLERDVENQRFLLDGICVAREARGKGIGTALLRAICEEGRARGYSAIRLDVIDSNLRARALYERQGFIALRRESIGPLRMVFGFSASTSMVKTI